MSNALLDLSKKTIGILGGMGPAAGANFQQLLIAKLNRAGVVEDSKFPRIIMLSIPLRDWDHRGAIHKAEVSYQVRQGVNWLESHGARLIAVPCNSVHEFIESPQVVNIIDETLAACSETKVVGVLCSRQSRDSRLYERNSTQQYIYLENQFEIDDTIARTLTGERPDISLYIGQLFTAGADVVVLGCTELSLCYRFRVFSAVVDSSLALATGVVRRLLAEDSSL